MPKCRGLKSELSIRVPGCLRSMENEEINAQVQMIPHDRVLQGYFTMSIKFGLFLVEQGIISCDQFCGLLKIQQMAAPSHASVAIRRNLLTVKQVGQILGLIELNRELDFIQAGKRLGLISATEQQRFDQEQQQLLPSIPFLLVECGLLRVNQVETLTRSFEKSQIIDAASQVSPSHQDNLKPTEDAALASGAQAAVHSPELQVATVAVSSTGVQGQRVHPAQPLRQPKFVQRPQVAQTEEAYYG